MFLCPLNRKVFDEEDVIAFFEKKLHLDNREKEKKCYL